MLGPDLAGIRFWAGGASRGNDAMGRFAESPDRWIRVRQLAR
jgi:hypothetical protein